MRVIVLFFLSFFLLACGDPRENRPTLSSSNLRVVDTKVFDSYVNSFAREYRRFVGDDFDLDEVDITMVEDLPGNAVGQCQTDTKEIRIHRRYWLNSDQVARKALIYHELGHCFLGRGHRPTRIGDMPVSLMFPTIDEPERYFEAFEREYIEELFTRKTQQFGGAVAQQDQRSISSMENLEINCHFRH